MKVQVLGTVQAVNDREYTRKDGAKGVAHGVIFNVNGELLQGEIYHNGDEWQKMGCRAGAVGTMAIWLSTQQRQSKDGRNYMSNEWRFMDFRLANASAPSAPAAPAEEHQEQAAPAAPAQAADVDPNSQVF